MGVVHAPDSAFAREMVKWEARDGLLGTALRPYVKREYPMMLHKAKQRIEGGIEIAETQIVHTDAERAKYEPQGFRATPLEAVTVLEAEQLNHAELAAERNFEVRRMSSKARAEVERVEEASGAVHLPMIPETPIGPRRVPVRLDASNVDHTILENAEEQIRVQQTELETLRATIAELQAVKPQVELSADEPKRKRGRPKKAVEA